jgi:hypothetical protein
MSLWHRRTKPKEAPMALDLSKLQSAADAVKALPLESTIEQQDQLTIDSITAELEAVVAAQTAPPTPPAV